jgi:hypothetical protein
MTWSRLEDELGTHPKLHAAGRDLGENGRVIALGFFVLALMWSNRHLTDGYVPDAVIDWFSSYVTDPKAIAEALSKAGLFERNDGGYHIHDFSTYNPSAVEIKRKRQADALRKAKEREALNKRLTGVLAES